MKWKIVLTNLTQYLSLNISIFVDKHIFHLNMLIGGHHLYSNEMVFATNSKFNATDSATTSELERKLP